MPLEVGDIVRSTKDPWRVGVIVDEVVSGYGYAGHRSTDFAIRWLPGDPDRPYVYLPEKISTSNASDYLEVAPGTEPDYRTVTKAIAQYYAETLTCLRETCLDLGRRLDRVDGTSC